MQAGMEDKKKGGGGCTISLQIADNIRDNIIMDQYAGGNVNNKLTS